MGAFDVNMSFDVGRQSVAALCACNGRGGNCSSVTLLYAAVSYCYSEYHMPCQAVHTDVFL